MTEKLLFNTWTVVWNHLNGFLTREQTPLFCLYHFRNTILNLNRHGIWHIAHVIHVSHYSASALEIDQWKSMSCKLKTFYHQISLCNMWGCIYPLNLIIFSRERGRGTDFVCNKWGYAISEVCNKWGFTVVYSDSHNGQKVTQRNGWFPAIQ